MSDTPRTDARVFDADLVTAEFARNLERELKSAQLDLAAERSRANNLAAQLNAAEARAGRLQNQIDNLLKPMRDKAIAERDAEKARAATLRAKIQELSEDRGENMASDHWSRNYGRPTEWIQEWCDAALAATEGKQ